MTATSAPTFRKTKTGQWVVFGPADIVTIGEVAVSKRDGSTKTETVERVGKTFDVDGIACCYGYVVKTAASTPRSVASRRAHGRSECYECGAYGPTGTTCRECHEGTHA